MGGVLVGTVMLFGFFQGWENLGDGGGIPGERAGHTLVYDGSHLLLFGGVTSSTAPTNDLKVWDPTTSTWSTPPWTGAVPSPRAYIQGVWDSTAGRMIVFGGSGALTKFNDVYAYTPSTYEWANITPTTGSPSARSGYAAIYDPVTNRMIVFGGWISGTTATAQTWALGLGVGGISWSPLAPMPAARFFHSAVFDPSSRTAYVFGGGPNFATWTNTVYAYHLDTNTWSTPSDDPGTGPGARGFATCVWDPINARLLMYGGGNLSTVYSNFWAFHPSTGAWEPLSGGPGDRMAAAGAWSTTQNAFYLFGGAVGITITADFTLTATMAPGDLWSYVVPTANPEGNGGGGDHKKRSRCGGAAGADPGATTGLTLLLLLAACCGVLMRVLRTKSCT